MRLLLILMAAICLPLQAQKTRPSNSDRELLEKAIDYFVSSKYHEALLIFEKLDGQYKLNPRYWAYMGYCYYFDWEYASAIRYFEQSLPQLDALSPHELSLYYYSLAESHFNLEHYSEAIPAYEQHLLRCYPNERADALYRLGFIYLFNEEKALAFEYFSSACCCYQYFQPGEQARIQQLQRMVRGLQAELSNTTEPQKE